jgi:hypothetical protein
VLEAVETALRKSGVATDKPQYLLFLGEIPRDDSKTVGEAILIECSPMAQLNSRFPPNQVAVYGMIYDERRDMLQAMEHMITNALTIGMEIDDGVRESLLARHAHLPATAAKTAHVYCTELSSFASARASDIFTPTTYRSDLFGFVGFALAGTVCKFALQ